MMRVEIEKLNKKSYEARVLLEKLHKITGTKKDFEGYGLITSELSDEADIVIFCDNFFVNKDCVSIQFLDGTTSDYNITNYDYWRIAIQ